jgi:hypothetical protein
MDIEVTCGRCEHNYDDVAEDTYKDGNLGDYFVELRISDCPLCGFDNSGLLTVESGLPDLN